MKQIFSLALVLAVAACGWNQRLQADDGAPIPAELEVKHPLERYQQVSLAQASQWGLDGYSLDTGGGEYGLYLLFSQQLRSAIEDNRASLHLSFWNGGQLLFAVPGFSLADGPFLMQEGYQLQVMLNPKDGYAGLEPGTGYYVKLDPHEHVKAL